MKRYLTIKELMEYLNVGRDSARKFADSCGATVHIGRRVVYDICTIDDALSKR